MRIIADGKVGIGTADPLAQLHIENDSTYNSALFVKAADGQTARPIWFQDYDGNTQFTIYNNGRVGIGTDPRENIGTHVK